MTVNGKGQCEMVSEPKHVPKRTDFRAGWS
jgi:hypothetical protein